MKTTTMLMAAGTAVALASNAFAGPMAPVAPLDVPTVVPAADEGLGFSLSVGYDSNYIFRGVDVGDNLVWAGLEYERGLTEVVGLNLGAWWASLADDDYNELDLYGGLTFGLGPVDLSIGYIWYYYPNPIDDSTGEIYGSLGYEFYGVGLELYYGYDHEIEGGYGAFSAGYSYAATEMISLDFSTGISMSHDYYFDGTGWNNWDIRLAVPIALTDTATLEPYIAGSVAIDDLDDVADDYFYGGVSLSVSF